MMLGGGVERGVGQGTRVCGAVSMTKMITFQDRQFLVKDSSRMTTKIWACGNGGES